MGKLLDIAIASSKAAASTSQLVLNSGLGSTTNNRAQWYKNGTLVGTFTSEQIITLNSTDTFYITAVRTLAPAGCTLYIYKNAVLQETQAANTITSATYTAGSGNTWDVSVIQGL